MITLHHLNKSRSKRIIWLLEELGVDYQIKPYLRDSVSFLAPPELKSVHPLGKSPVIEDQGMIITESGAITDYLIETYGNGRFAPQRGTKEHLEYSQWLHFAESSGILPLLLKIFVAKDGCETNFLAQYAEDENSKIMAYLEQSLEGKSYLVGETLTGADFMMSFIVEAMDNFGASHAYPNLVAYTERLKSHPSFQKSDEIEQKHG